ncbi:MAG: aminotransferase class I/II-fold pyridoxal phosphate-dependent enzyme [Oscillospiraceae bacterium]|nr:aminotransferase class I/II-fold pyridoxal phosphate-dependent enzyme [Oscillospiraceae bacterium]
MKTETACLHAVRDATHSTGAVAVPIYQSATFAHPGVGQSTGYDYARLQNPTREHVENLVCALEGGVGALAFASGMAAVATLMELFAPGDEIIATDDLYGGSIRLFNHVLAKNGVHVRYADTSDLAETRAAITEHTKGIFIESPTNPMMKLTDIAGVKALCAGRDILLMVDNTFLTPYFCQPIPLGADVVIHSGTKYLAGHNDTLAGFLVAGSPALTEKLRFLHKTIGAVLAPFDAFLVTRGIKTLAIRMEKSQQNARQIAAWLRQQPKVEKVFYPGIGAMISFALASEADAIQALNKTALILYAESLGGVETLITYPMTQTHADVPEGERLARGIDARLLRLSVGIEAAADLIADLEVALQ